MSYMLPGTAVQADDPVRQAKALLRNYSPRLFGAPPQLTNQCDMRILSSGNGNPGAVGDYYLTHVLQDASIANFVVGRARFMGGMSSYANILRECVFYGRALKQYNIFDKSSASIGGESISESLLKGEDKETYQSAYNTRDTEETSVGLASALKAAADFVSDVDDEATIADVDSIDGAKELLGQFSTFGAGLVAAIKTSLSVQQPFYTFEDDWFTYINNVKMMINTAVIMLGLQGACVRIGDYYYPIGMDASFKGDTDVWANYRYITPESDTGSVTAKVDSTGNTSQYVSFMIDPVALSESYQNSIGQSQIYSSVINSGSSVGSEIAFITNATGGGTTDKMVSIAKDSKAAAEDILKNLSSGNGRFTAAIASSMARSFTGDHTIYPEVFQGHTSHSSTSITVHLASDAGDPYSYLINILVPMFFIFGMALPSLSSSNASAYTFPPIIQCNIPGMWGTRLGMIESISVSKNPNGKDVSVNGYPLAVDINISIKDLQHTLTTSPMNKISTFLNNHTMFDYIAQISGVDKYRVNGSIRTAARLALASSAVGNAFNNISDALLTDWHSLANRVTGYSLQ